MSGLFARCFFTQSPSPPHKRMILFSGLEFILSLLLLLQVYKTDTSLLTLAKSI